MTRTSDHPLSYLPVSFRDPPFPRFLFIFCFFAKLAEHLILLQVGALRWAKCHKSICALGRTTAEQHQPALNKAVAKKAFSLSAMWTLQWQLKDIWQNVSNISRLMASCQAIPTWLLSAPDPEAFAVSLGHQKYVTHGHTEHQASQLIVRSIPVPGHQQRGTDLPNISQYVRQIPNDYKTSFP